MKPNEVHDFLIKIRPAPKEFRVEMTGKAHGRINGLYYPDELLIKIHDRNFSRETTMLYTAIHEYAHHLQFCQREKTSHNREFWTLFHDLLDEAIGKKIFEPQPVNDKINQVEAELKDLLRQHADIEVKIAEKISDLNTECAELATRTEYELERRLQLPHGGARAFEKCARGSAGYRSDEYRNAEEMRVIALGGVDAEMALREGKTIVQAQSIAAKKVELEPYEALRKERDQIARRMGKLEDREKVVIRKMEQMELDFGTGRTDDTPATLRIGA